MGGRPKGHHQYGLLRPKVAGPPLCKVCLPCWLHWRPDPRVLEKTLQGRAQRKADSAFHANSHREGAGGRPRSHPADFSPEESIRLQPGRAGAAATDLEISWLL